MEIVCGTDPTNSADGTPEILMIACRKDSAAALAKPGDTLAVFYGKAITGINCEEPQLINVLMIQLTQEDIVACSVFLPIIASFSTCSIVWITQ